MECSRMIGHIGHIDVPKHKKESSHIDDSEPIQSVGDEEKPYSLGKIIMPIRATTENGRFSVVV